MFLGDSLEAKLSTLDRATKVRILVPQPFPVGGAKRDRTADLYNAIVALSQLSYGPIFNTLLF